MAMPADYLAQTVRRWGYLQADIDPFGRLPHFRHAELDSLSGPEVEKWRNVYCGTIAAEFMHMPYPDRCAWVAEAMEGPAVEIDRNAVLRRILSSELFERYIHTRYIGNKRFSLEGLVGTIPFLDELLSRAEELGFETVLIGMSHRGRLNVMVHITGIAAQNIFAGFEDIDPRSVLGSGDVKYHKGATGSYPTRSGNTIGVHLASNPSHLEAINAVITGRVRARQDRRKDTKGERVLCVLLHGDAAFAGQGITAETLNFAELEGFSIGGTVHVILNNLIGFTAEPHSLHSSRFASDIARRLPIPIFHVNGECPDSVVRTARMALEYRHKFASEVVVDLIGYRRFGHSEVDDPTVTSPLLYEQISSRPELSARYAKEIGVGEDDLKTLEQEILSHYREEHQRGQEMTKQPEIRTFPKYWKDYKGGFYDRSFEVETKVDNDTLLSIAQRTTTVNDDFNIHPKLKKGLADRFKMVQGERAVDWGMAETLAFGSLLLEGTPVRLTGQDSCRGTFAHRQSVLHDMHTNAPYTPLQHLDPSQAQFSVYNSMLSEAAALAFEYGYSRDCPEGLILWEAQFGDFANGAQIIIDQFITAGEDKWSLLSGLVMLLPHGFEGQGPEHSSARLERFLQLSAEDNIQVCYPSTAGQYFHLLRRQALRKWRKPLIVMTPKSMLRAQAACSPIEELTHGTFQNVKDMSGDTTEAERLIFCTGKISHELARERTKRKEDNTAIAAVEQLYPFPEDEIRDVLARYASAKTIIWVQEEPANMGALSYIRPLLQNAAGSRKVTTVRRSESASPATGSPNAHSLEQQAIIRLAFASYA